MKEKFKKILKILGIVILYLPAILCLCILILSCYAGITEEWATKTEWLNTFAFIIFACMILIFIPIIIVIISLWYAFSKRNTPAKFLKKLYIFDAITIVIMFLLAPTQELVTAQEMETNYLAHKSDIEALVRYVNASAKPHTKIEIKRKDITPTDSKTQQTIKQMMEKANVYEIEMTTVNADSFKIYSELVYKYYPARHHGTSYNYKITLNTSKDDDNSTFIDISPCPITYNDSVGFIDYYAMFGGCHFPDRDKYLKEKGLEIRD